MAKSEIMDKETNSLENIMGIFFMSSFLSLMALMISVFIWNIGWIIACAILIVANGALYIKSAKQRNMVNNRKDGANAR